jgi:capsid protein
MTTATVVEPGSFVGFTLPTAGYDAAQTTTKRRPPSGKTEHEDAALCGKDRKRVISSARDVQRNFAVAAWMIRKHLDYVATFNFQSQSGDSGFDRELEAIVKEWSAAEACHDAGLLDFATILRVAECCAVVDGDCGLMKIKTGHLQGFESDLIGNPEKTEKGERWINGLRLANTGDLPNRPVEFGLYRYNDSGKPEFERRVKAENFYLHRYASRFNQFRGISPFTAGINSLKDLYEGFDYALAKMKVEQLFALSIFSEAQETPGNLDSTEAVDEDGAEVDAGGYKVDFGKGPVLLQLDAGDRAEFLKSDNPGGNTREFLLAVVMVAMKSLDLPYSFFDESFTNFFGSRAAWMHYNRSATSKRDNLRKLSDWWFRWRVQLAVQAGNLDIPAGLTLDRPWWEFVSVGMPWWDESKEVAGDVDAIKAGLNTPQRIVRERSSGDYYQNVDDIAKAVEYARKRNVTLSFMAPAVEPVKPAESKTDADRTDDGEPERSDGEGDDGDEGEKAEG